MSLSYRAPQKIGCHRKSIEISYWLWFLPRTNAIFRAQRQQRFAKVLDSIANVSVAAPQHEVIAVAFNVTSSSTNLYMAGNHIVPPNTVSHLNKLWSLLQDFSNDYEQYNQLSNSSNSPPQPRTLSLPLAAQKRVMQFCRDSLKFCCHKLNRRINKHYTSLLAVESTELSLIQQTITGLAKLMKDRDTLSDRRWDLAWEGLSNLQVETTRFFHDNLDLSELMANPFPAQRYLEKVVAFPKDIRILLNAANSPRLRTHFQNPFTISTLDPIGAAAAPPLTIVGWEEVASKALEEGNRGKTEEFEYEAVPSKVKADARKLVQTRPLPPRNFVHC